MLGKMKALALRILGGSVAQQTAKVEAYISHNFFKTMKTINFHSQLINGTQLQNLKDELDSVGVKAFIINYETQQISIMNPESIEADTLTCAVRKAGFKCGCFRVCKHGRD
jgi:hypothetical protein